MIEVQNIYTSIQIYPLSKLFNLLLCFSLLWFSYVQIWKVICYNIRSYGRKTLEYEFHTHTPKSSNQNAVFIGYNILIECFTRTSKKTCTRKFYDCKAWSHWPIYLTIEWYMFSIDYTHNVICKTCYIF